MTPKNSKNRHMCRPGSLVNNFGQKILSRTTFPTPTGPETPFSDYEVVCELDLTSIARKKKVEKVDI